MNARILVVDDDDRFRRLLATYLEHAGFAVAQASDGPAGLALARAWAPDMVVLDNHGRCRRSPGLSSVACRSCWYTRLGAHVP